MGFFEIYFKVISLISSFIAIPAGVGYFISLKVGFISFLALFILTIALYFIGKYLDSTYWLHCSEDVCTFDIKKPDGSFAKFKRISKGVVKRKGITKKIIKGIGADGELSNFDFSPGIANIQQESGTLNIDVIYDPELPINKEIEFINTYDMTDCFLKNYEYVYINQLERPTKILKVFIIFPPQITEAPKSLQAFKYKAGFTQREIEPTIKKDNNQWTIRWEIKNPKIDVQYRIEWNWNPIF